MRAHFADVTRRLGSLSRQRLTFHVMFHFHLSLMHGNPLFSFRAGILTANTVAIVSQATCPAD